MLKRLQGIGEKLVSALGSGISGTTREMHSDPIVEIVAHLPKEELAAMAEALAKIGWSCAGSATDVPRFLELSRVFDENLTANAHFRDRLTAAYTNLAANPHAI